MKNKPLAKDFFLSPKSRLRLINPFSKFTYLANFKKIEDKPRRILCATAAGLGDTIMIAPAVAALKNALPDASITLLCHHNRKINELCEIIPSIDNSIDIGLKNYTWPQITKFLLSNFFKLLLKLRKERFDLVIVFMPNPVRRLLTIFLNCKYWIYSNRINDYPGSLAFTILDKIGIEGKNNLPVFKIPTPKKPADILAPDLTRPLICVNPFCGMQWRQWDKFDSLLDELTKFNASIAVIGKSANYHPPSGVINLVNKLTIPQLFWLINNCDLFITADSGPMHIAFALNIPSVALFSAVKPSLRTSPQYSATHSILYNPDHQSEKTQRVTQRKQLDTSNIQRVTVSEVIDAAKNCLTKNKLHLKNNI